jgi:hypothetical protein
MLGVLPPACSDVESAAGLQQTRHETPATIQLYGAGTLLKTSATKLVVWVQKPYQGISNRTCCTVQRAFSDNRLVACAVQDVDHRLGGRPPQPVVDTPAAVSSWKCRCSNCACHVWASASKAQSWRQGYGNGHSVIGKWVLTNVGSVRAYSSSSSSSSSTSSSSGSIGGSSFHASGCVLVYSTVLSQYWCLKQFRIKNTFHISYILL